MDRFGILHTNPAPNPGAGNPLPARPEGVAFIDRAGTNKKY